MCAELARGLEVQRLTRRHLHEQRQRRPGAILGAVRVRQRHSRCRREEPEQSLLLRRLPRLPDPERRAPDRHLVGNALRHQIIPRKLHLPVNALPCFLVKFTTTRQCRARTPAAARP